MRNRFHRIVRFLGSMRFAIVLLAVLAAACAAASTLTQGQSYAWYAQRYGERTAAFIAALDLDDAFHSPWFIVLSAFLCLDLLLCNLVRVKALIRRTRMFAEPGHLLSITPECSAWVRQPEKAFPHLNMGIPAQSETDGKSMLSAVRGRAGLWGAWVCHLGILLLILFFSLGQTLEKQYTVYGVPGQSMAVGSTGYIATIDDFRIDKSESGFVEQYTTRFTLRDANGATTAQSAQVSVNHPARLRGMKFFQNSTGWAAKASVTKNGEPLQSQWLCAGEYLEVSDKPGLTVLLSAVYPDYIFVPGAGPKSLSDSPVNPAYLYSVYYNGQLVGMNVLMQSEELTVDEYAVSFSEPSPYTLLQVKQNSFSLFALLGGLITAVGLLLALYVQPVRVWAVSGQDGLWRLFGENRKGGKLFAEAFAKAAEKAQISTPEDGKPNAED